METFTHIHTQISQEELFLLAYEQGYAAALWRLPNSDQIHCLIDFSRDIKPQPLQAEQWQKKKGFLFSPFENENLQNNYFLKADFYTNSVTDLKEVPFIEQQTLQKLKENSIFVFQPQIILPHRSELKIKHIDLVLKSIEAIHKKHFQKVVLSRREKIKFTEKISLRDVFKRLCKFYPSSFISAVYVPGHNIWMGVSPEILISVDRQNIFRTMALAGTQQYLPDVPLFSITWTQKEIEEQALVAGYIINAFKKIRLREFEEEGPRTVRAGNLVHLQTDFYVNLNEVNYPDLWQVMLELLHPTSAVCGMPKTESLAFIKTYEGYPREFYSGFLGPVNIDSEINIFVNLRCMQIMPSLREAYLYAGGGITMNSDPEKEWNETLLKMETLLKAIWATD